MKKLAIAFILVHVIGLAWSQSFSFEDIKGYPFPNELTSSATGSRIAWAFNEQGKRNIYVAEGPQFTPRKLTNYDLDEGQEITSLQISADGKWVVYIRGGDHGSNWNDAEPVNPAFSPTPTKVQIWSMPFAGGEPTAIGDGEEPTVSPKSDMVAFVKSNQIWTAPIDGSSPAKELFHARGRNNNIEWSPDGDRIAFVSDRSDHSFIGVYTNAETPVKWIAPSYSRDRSPRWSPDGNKIVFARLDGSGGAPDPWLENTPRPWSIWVGDVASESAKEIWKSPNTLRGSIPSTHGGFNLHWGAGDRVVYMSYEDGWPHLYSIASVGGKSLLLTPGNFMAEYIKMSPDRKWMVFCGNTGPDQFDIDRRHVVRVSVDKANMEVLTPGTGLEWTPTVTGDGSTIAMLSATAQRPPLPAVKSFDTKGSLKILSEDRIPASFPKNLVTPKQVIYKSPDGVTVHGQLFETAGGPAKKPGIIYVHGGPPRQMLLGWHYSDYYANGYATNQYLASLGFVVLSVNYRLGIGYGYEFHHPENASTTGASEYIDVKAGGEWLSKQPQVDASKIGIYGGSYGGYLTAMALGRDSKLFAAGVDVHGVHDRTVNRIRNILLPDQYEKAADAEKAATVAWQSSPVSSIDTWTSPVLIIHGDDDRNVRFDQSTDLVQRLKTKGVPMETIVIVDDTHHWMMFRNSLKAGNATADFFKRKLMTK